MFNMGPMEIAIIFMLILILFGAKRLPELARSMGRSIKEFKTATQDIREQFDIDEDRPPVAAGRKETGEGSKENKS